MSHDKEHICKSRRGYEIYLEQGLRIPGQGVQGGSCQRMLSRMTVR